MKIWWIFKRFYYQRHWNRASLADREIMRRKALEGHYDDKPWNYPSNFEELDPAEWNRK